MEVAAQLAGSNHTNITLSKDGVVYVIQCDELHRAVHSFQLGGLGV